MKTNDAAVVPHSLFRSTAWFSGMTFISRLLGFVRDLLIAHLFGAVAAVDAFFVAFKIPNFMRRLFAEGAFSQAFVPVLSEHQRTKTPEEVRQFLSHIAGALTRVLLWVTLIAVLLSPVLVTLFAPGFSQQDPRFELASDMLRITFPYLMLISLTALSGSVLNTYGHFAIPALTPALLNVCMIAAALWLSPYLPQPVMALAWGVLLAGFVQCVFQLPFLHRAGLLVKPRVNWHDPAVKRVMKLLVPALFGVSVAQINILLDMVFASFLPVGSVSWLYFSDRMMNFPLGVFGVAIATVILPHLSRKHAEKSTAAFSSALDWGIRSVLLIGVPSALGLFLLAGPLLVTLLGYGKFTTHDVMMARLSLMAFAFGVPALMLVKVLASGFYARQDIKTPVKVGVLAMCCNVLLNVLLIGPLAHAGLALATTLAAAVNVSALGFMLLRKNLYQPCAGWWGFAVRLLIANGLLVAWLYGHSEPLADWLDWSRGARAWQLMCIIVEASTIYGVALWLMGVRLKHVKQ